MSRFSLFDYADLANFRLAYILGIVEDYEEFRRRHAAMIKEKFEAAIEASGARTEVQQQAISRLLAGRGGGS